MKRGDAIDVVSHTEDCRKRRGIRRQRALGEGSGLKENDSRTRWVFSLSDLHHLYIPRKPKFISTMFIAVHASSAPPPWPSEKWRLRLFG